ncbi:hypothetical protein [Lysobacter firmicutimachus]|uniref:DUF4386 family protein n=1 Tax=Lysobacter firmicutimachus TaxID=1792846 RepID=A0ABU8DAN8_9GAMM
MSLAPTAAARSPLLVPLALAAALFAASALLLLIGALAVPEAVRSELKLAPILLQWLCKDGLLAGLGLAVACVLTQRRGAPRRPIGAAICALLLAFAVALLWSTTVDAWLYGRLGGQRRELEAAFAGSGLLKAAAQIAVAWPLAWWIGGRGATPVAWSGAARRAIGALVGGGVCAGLVLALQQGAAGFAALDGDGHRSGMSAVALAVGAVLALVAGVWPLRSGHGALGALAAAALTPLLLLAAAVPLALYGQALELPMLIALALALIVAAPLLAWLTVRALHRRGRPVAPAD